MNAFPFKGLPSNTSYINIIKLSFKSSICAFDFIWMSKRVNNAKTIQSVHH